MKGASDGREARGVRQLNHVVGFPSRPTVWMPPRRCGRTATYGVSKAFGECCRVYYDRYGVETVCMRIVVPRRWTIACWSTWLSLRRDDRRSFAAQIFTPNVGHTVVHAASDNKPSWWDKPPGNPSGWTPKIRPDPFRAEVETNVPRLPADDPAAMYPGGSSSLAPTRRPDSWHC